MLYRSFLKRIFSVVFAAVAILLCLPVLLPVCFVLLLTGEHDIFYFQKRLGRNRMPFFMWKFATMLRNSEKMPGGIYTTRNDPRVFPFGKFLRKTKINELPQLVNILKGDMAFVGPRPLVERTFNLYPPQVQEKIYNVRPGLTGIGSVIFRDEEGLISRSAMPPEEFYRKFIAPYKGELELWYQNNISFLTDSKIIFLTAWVILFPSSNLPYTLFPTLPPKPDFLEK